jgi:hypothetical protein
MDSQGAQQIGQSVGQNAGITLIQYGAIGALLVIFLGLFLWVFYKVINHLLDEWSKQWQQITTFMDEQVKALRAVQDSINASQREIISEFRAYHREPTNPRIPLGSLPPPRNR